MNECRKWMALERVTDTQSLLLHDAARSGRALFCYEALAVSLSETAPGADLGGGSKYPNGSFEDPSGESFHVNSCHSSWHFPTLQWYETIQLEQS